MLPHAAGVGQHRDVLAALPLCGSEPRPHALDTLNSVNDDDPARSVTFRFANEEDVPDVLALWQVAAENDARPSDDVTKTVALIHRDAEALEIAIIDGHIVGSLVSGWDGWRAHLYRLAVHPDARRQGIGRKLLARAEIRLKSLGASRIDAMVLEHNELGQSIWTAEGYAKQPEWRRWVRAVANDSHPTSRVQ